jgi:hypothetical protein
MQLNSGESSLIAAQARFTANLEDVRMIIRAFGIALAALIVLYVADDTSARFRIPGNRPTFGSVMVRRTYLVPQKNKKLEYYFDPPEEETCVNSLFPHFDVQPCWYLNRHKSEKIAM